MILKKLELKSFRGFENLELEFNPDLNIFIGVNGAGKTSILDACSLVMSQVVARLVTNENERVHFDHWFESDDVNFKSKESIIKVYLENDSSLYRYTLKKNIFDEASFEVFRPEEGDFIADIKKNLTKESSVPLLLYVNASKDFKVDVALDETQIKKQNKHLPQLDVYLDASNKKTYSFKDFGLWWRIEEDKENEKRLRSDPAYRSPQLEVVRLAQKQFLEILKGDQYDNMFISRTNPDPSNYFFIAKEGDLFVKKDNAYIKLAQLSDGEKQILLLVSDISRRLVTANPNNPEVLKKGQGIVLVDEVDQHLHPGWQRKIVPALREVFPSIQFILTTHSPQVLSQVQHEKIFLLDNCKVYSVPETYGRDSNEILELVFDVPESPFKDKIKNIYKLISQKKYSEAIVERNILVKDMGSDYNEIVRIDQFLEGKG